MSAKYVPVQWTRSKVLYDLVILSFVAGFVITYVHLAPPLTRSEYQADGAIVRARAFGSCALLMLTLVLCIGPLARLDRRFLPLLYNRRHLGVITFLVALTHAMFVIDWYFAFSPIPKLEALFGANTSYDRLIGFPFETLGALALWALALLAVTSHDFWLSFLGPRLWKSFHYAVYAAYALVVAHIGLGALQSRTDPTLAIVVGCAVAVVCSLHAAAALRERAASGSTEAGEWVAVAPLGAFVEGRARIVRFAGGDRAAVFLHEGRLSAVSNACAHQNGPLGEGRVIGDCVTCPWHGFQYRLTDGRAPAPYTEKIPTYALKREGELIFIASRANPPGTYVAPLDVAET